MHALSRRVSAVRYKDRWELTLMLGARTGKLAHQHAAQLAAPVEMFGLILGDGAVVVAHAVGVGRVIELLGGGLVPLLLLAVDGLEFAVGAAHVKRVVSCHGGASMAVRRWRGARC